MSKRACTPGTADSVNESTEYDVGEKMIKFIIVPKPNLPRTTKRNAANLTSIVANIVKISVRMNDVDIVDARDNIHVEIGATTNMQNSFLLNFQTKTKNIVDFAMFEPRAARNREERFYDINKHKQQN